MSVMRSTGFRRPNRRSAARALTIIAAAVLLASSVLRSAPQNRDAELRARANAFFEALASGNADRYEAMAQQHFTPGFLARRTPDDRKGLVARITADFGTLTLQGMRNVNDETLTFVVHGATGLDGRVELTMETAPPYRIDAIGIEVGGAENAAQGPPPPPINGSMTAAELGQALDAYLATLTAADAFAGVVAVAKHGAPIYQRAYGLADRDKKIPATPATRFNLGSINKAFTKTAIGQLIAQGKLALTDTIGSVLPDYPNAEARPATVEQLLTHQAGIADFFGPAFEAAPKTGFRSNADYYRFVAKMPLLFAPGARRQYCNGCYIVLGAIVERVSGVRYEDYVAAHVFQPAGMTGAGAFQSDRLPPDVALGYTRQSATGDVPLHGNQDMHGASGSAAGGGYATAADLLAFDNAMRDGRLLSPAMTAWFLELASAPTGRAGGAIGIAGGAPGVNAILETNATWAVAVVTNLDPPAAAGVGLAISRALSR
jgi:D-alanyl-D-alanine carboxypeptidase